MKSESSQYFLRGLLFKRSRIAPYVAGKIPTCDRAEWNGAKAKPVFQATDQAQVDRWHPPNEEALEYVAGGQTPGPLHLYLDNIELKYVMMK
jgi:hypothetical protein